VLDLWGFSRDAAHAMGSLNAFLARGPERWAQLRADLQMCLTDETYRGVTEPFLVPLGPFLGKSFLTSVSPWVVPLGALDAARVPAPARDPQPLPCLRDDDQPWGLDLALEVRLNGEVVSRPPFSTQY
jgi:Fumarylacetoacetate (FAA) hydrolase family